MGRPPKAELLRAFRVCEKADGGPGSLSVRYFLYYVDLQDKYACRHCSYTITKHATRMETHLLSCEKYLSDCTTKGISNEIMRKAAIRTTKPEHQISFSKITITSAGKEELDRLAAAVCLIEGYPFILFVLSKDIRSLYFRIRL